MPNPTQKQLVHWLLCAVETLYEVRKQCPNTEASKIAGQGICLIGISKTELTQLFLDGSEARKRPKTRSDAVRLLTANDWTLEEIEAALAPVISEDEKQARDIIRRAAANSKKHEPR